MLITYALATSALMKRACVHYLSSVLSLLDMWYNHEVDSPVHKRQKRSKGTTKGKFLSGVQDLLMNYILKYVFLSHLP